MLFNPGDHPFETPLCFGQAAFYDQMAEEVANIPDRESFETYFDECRGKFTGLFAKEPELKVLDNPGFYSTFQEIIEAEKPRPEYVNIASKDRYFFEVVKVAIQT